MSGIITATNTTRFSVYGVILAREMLEIWLNYQSLIRSLLSPSKSLLPSGFKKKIVFIANRRNRFLHEELLEQAPVMNGMRKKIFSIEYRRVDRNTPWENLKAHQKNKNWKYKLIRRSMLHETIQEMTEKYFP